VKAFLLVDAGSTPPKEYVLVMGTYLRLFVNIGKPVSFKKRS
jgi:hypothetical protein